MNKGIWYGVGAYVLWGFFPIYWKLLIDVPALQVIGHRIGWSFIFLLMYVVLRRQWRAFRASVVNWRMIGIYLIASVLLSFNWLIYVWGVNAGFVVETSLGYFINPLFYVLLGVVFLRERLRVMQWIPVGLAAIGVAYLTFVYGRLPWIALSLAFTFGMYGFVKKLSPLGSLHGLTLETGLAFPVAVIYIAVLGFNGTGAFLAQGAWIDIYLIGAGLVTTIPLLLFASAAKSIPLVYVGLLQYIAPTIQFLIGVFLYSEPFERSHLVGFSLVWLALIIFAVENYMANRATVKPVTQS